MPQSNEAAYYTLEPNLYDRILVDNLWYIMHWIVNVRTRRKRALLKELFTRLTVDSLCIISICDLVPSHLDFEGRRFGSDYTSSWSLFTFTSGKRVTSSWSLFTFTSGKQVTSS